MVQKLGEAGIKWSTETDKFTVPLTVKSPTGAGPDVTKATAGILEEATLTRRINLSLTMSLYDPGIYRASHDKIEVAPATAWQTWRKGRFG